mmetsp:Transcript_37705/g.88317  ORF Transcript_37705/g.88317 Transcript_37705/m.88317 type:complete len:347 (-) Transcript_37705:278-1318(-)
MQKHERVRRGVEEALEEGAGEEAEVGLRLHDEQENELEPDGAACTRQARKGRNAAQPEGNPQRDFLQALNRPPIPDFDAVALEELAQDLQRAHEPRVVPRERDPLPHGAPVPRQEDLADRVLVQVRPAVRVRRLEHHDLLLEERVRHPRVQPDHDPERDKEEEGDSDDFPPDARGCHGAPGCETYAQELDEEHNDFPVRKHQKAGRLAAPRGVSLAERRRPLAELPQHKRRSERDAHSLGSAHDGVARRDVARCSHRAARVQYHLEVAPVEPRGKLLDRTRDFVGIEHRHHPRVLDAVEQHERVAARRVRLLPDDRRLASDRLEAVVDPRGEEGRGKPEEKGTRHE